MEVEMYSMIWWLMLILFVVAVGMALAYSNDDVDE